MNKTRTEGIQITPGEISNLKIIGPNKNIIRFTEKILDQNKTILEMNSRLLLVLAAPVRVMEKYDIGWDLEDQYNRREQELKMMGKINKKETRCKNE